MKRELKITIKDDDNHYALIEQVNNRESEINRGIFLDKDQYEQLRQYFISVVVCDECTDGSGWYTDDEGLITYNCSKCNPEANR